MSRLAGLGPPADRFAGGSGLGPAAWPAARLLHAVPRQDRRLRSSDAWRGFTQDQEIRAAVDELLAVCE
ncbi:hypothetical protein [Streptomyces sp. NPDC058157]|uniref:hypothetical protein n=1 Tax=Streptomyces sp. NPDC058157 TaxID=3346360 RepID=UPI0036E841F1